MHDSARPFSRLQSTHKPSPSGEGISLSFVSFVSFVVDRCRDDELKSGIEAGRAAGRAYLVTQALHYLGRFGQLAGMWILLVDVFTAGPLGPNPRLFALGVAVFLAGWGLTRVAHKS